MSDPLSPTPLSEDEARIVEDARQRFDGGHRTQVAWGEFLGAELVAIIDTLTSLSRAITLPEQTT